MASGHMMAGFKGQYVGGSHHEFRHRHANMPPAHHYVPAQGQLKEKRISAKFGRTWLLYNNLLNFQFSESFSLTMIVF